jgi:hypothetical protein
VKGLTDPPKQVIVARSIVLMVDLKSLLWVSQRTALSTANARTSSPVVPAQGSVGQNPYVKQKLRLVLPLTVLLVVIGGTAFVIWWVVEAPGDADVLATVLTAIALVPPCCFGRGEPVGNLKVKVPSHESSEWLPPTTCRSGR